MPDASKNLADTHLQWQRSHAVIPSGGDEALIVPRSGTPISFSRPSRRSVSPAHRAPAPTPPCHSAPVEKSRSGSHRPAAICERSVTPRSGPRAHANGDTMVGFEGPRRANEDEAVGFQGPGRPKRPAAIGHQGACHAPRPRVVIRVVVGGDSATRTSGCSTQRPTRRGDGVGHPAMPRSLGSPVTGWANVDVAHRQDPGRHPSGGRPVDRDPLVAGVLLAAPAGAGRAVTRTHGADDPPLPPV